MTQAVITAILLVAGVGLVAGLLLAVASTVFAVKVNEIEVAVRDCLPGANCGACGYSGCDGYAKALGDGSETATTLCRPGGADASAKIAEILGVEASTAEAVAAFVHCDGDCEKCQSKQVNQGASSCAASKLLFGGEGACTFGCLGCGDCKNVCEYNAIYLKGGIAHIYEKNCVGCGMCVKTCPNHIISLLPQRKVAVMTCSNHEKGAVVRKECSNGCIGCMKCQNKCPFDAIHVEDNLATVDYDKCKGCGLCVKECPVGCLQLKNPAV